MAFLSQVNIMQGTSPSPATDPPPGLQRDKLATRPHPGPSLTW